MNQKRIKSILLVVIVFALVGNGAHFAAAQQTAPPAPNPSLAQRLSPSTTPDNSPVQTSPLNQVALSNNCQHLIDYSAREYQDGWEKLFKKENHISDSQFNSHITVNSVSLKPVGNTCQLSVRYIIKKDWLVVNREDGMTLGIPPTISPDNLPLESNPNKIGNIGISTINLLDQFSFKSEAEALDYFLNAYNLKGTNVTIQRRDFQYFGNKKTAEQMGLRFAGEGGEAFIRVRGTIDPRQNKCYAGELSLVSKKTTYQEALCMIGEMPNR
jgi:hypothetical protein